MEKKYAFQTMPKFDEKADFAMKSKAKATHNTYIKTIILTGFALASSGFQSNVFNLDNLIFLSIYGSAVFTNEISARIGNALFVGAIIGQLGFGILVDRLGRKIGLLLTTLFTFTGTVICAASFNVGGDPTGLFWMLTIGRGIAGIGAGGEYSCSSTSATEASEGVAVRKGRTMIMVTNFVLVFGGILAVCSTLSLLTIFNGVGLEPVWRGVFSLGAILPIPLFYFRLGISSSRRYRSEAIRQNVPYGLAFLSYWRYILGTAGTWFLYDFITYPNYIISSAIINDIVKDGGLIKIAEYQLLLQLLSLPGVMLGAWIVDRFGRRNLMALGFFSAGVSGILIGAFNDSIRPYPILFIVTYAFFLSSASFGPGNCVHLVSTEIYPTALRGTFYGLSAAVGKTGAAVGTQILVPLLRNSNGVVDIRTIFLVCGSVGLLGTLLTLALVPKYTSSSLSDEDVYWRHYLKEKGWNGHFGLFSEVSPLSGLEMQMET